jgi:hypothetical protein
MKALAEYSLRQVAVSWVRDTIRSQWQDDQSPLEMAENLVAIAESERVPVELLIEWLHHHRPGNQHWRAVCAEYAQLRRQLLQRTAGELLGSKAAP